MMPEKPWSRIYIDHAINFMGSNWLIVNDAYSKYPRIQQTSSTSTQATTTFLEEDFAHFGYLHTIVSDNTTTFRMVSLQKHQISHWSSISSSHQRGSGETRTILQTIYEEVKAATQTSPTGVFDAVSRTPLNIGFSPSQLLNGRQVRTKIASLLPSPAHITQERQATYATKSQQKEQSTVQHVCTRYSSGTPYATLCTVVRDIPTQQDEYQQLSPKYMVPGLSQ